jgi:hypothetical protein
MLTREGNPLPKSFEKIAAEAMKAAREIPCSLEVYAEGLQIIIADIQECLDVAQDELRDSRPREDDA